MLNNVDLCSITGDFLLNQHEKRTEYCLNRGVDYLYPKAYIDYLSHFHNDQDYFECHEILEEYWKENDKGNKTSVWVGFILLAVSCYHHRRNNFVGALKTIEKSQKILHLRQEDCLALGINVEELFSLLEKRKNDIKHKHDYSYITIPIHDPNLLKQLHAHINEVDDQIIHRHIFRDRTSIIQERKLALEKRKRNMVKGSEL